MMKRSTSEKPFLTLVKWRESLVPELPPRKRQGGYATIPLILKVFAGHINMEDIEKMREKDFYTGTSRINPDDKTSEGVFMELLKVRVA